ncbi:hypothetical protein WJX79_005428 [Trebouxia sp. C0005]
MQASVCCSHHSETGGEAHATISPGLGHFGGAPRVGIWFSTCLSNLFCVGSCGVILRVCFMTEERLQN